MSGARSGPAGAADDVPAAAGPRTDDRVPSAVGPADGATAEHAEAAAVRQRYARRAADDWRYHRLNPSALWPAQERERALARLLLDRGWRDLGQRRALEVGCGGGGNLLELLRLGFSPERLTGIELLAERHAAARRLLPLSVGLELGDATAMDAVPPASQDLVLQFTVFSSLLDDAVQRRLAAAMWRWTRPGGAVVWYDFTVDNPANRDVRGVPLARVRELFPAGRVEARRLTLAPPLARAVCRLHPALYTACNLLPWLRTHLLCRIDKPPVP